MQSVGVAFGILSIKVAIENQADTTYVLRLIEGIGNSLIGFTKIAVVVAPNSAVNSVYKIGAIPIVAGKCSFFCKRRDLTL